jgi:hypothetical protein
VGLAVFFNDLLCDARSQLVTCNIHWIHKPTSCMPTSGYHKGPNNIHVYRVSCDSLETRHIAKLQYFMFVSPRDVGSLVEDSVIFEVLNAVILIYIFEDIPSRMQ